VSYEVLQFGSLNDFLSYLDDKINEFAKKVDLLSKRYEALRARAERMRRLEQVLQELVGEKISSLNEVDFMGLKVVVGARASDELRVVEDALNSAKDVLTALRKVREILTKLASAIEKAGETSEGTFIVIVQTLNHIPVRILLKETVEYGS